jgi:hypothetical protein
VNLVRQMRSLFRVAGIVVGTGCSLSSILGAASIDLKRGQHQIDVVVDGKPFTTYYLLPDVVRPYLMPLRTPSGLIVTRGFPVQNDVSGANPKASSFEPHQRPLFFGHGNIDGLDFWQEATFDKYYTDHGHQAYGHMVLKSVDIPRSGSDPNKIQARFELADPNNRVIAEETQTFIFNGDAKTRRIDCEFVVRATAGPVDFGDTKEGSFGIRLAPELSAPHEHMLNSQGAKGERDIWGKPADWVEYSGTIQGKQVGIAVFDHPTSFRHPTTWHARAYGLLAANPFGLREFTKDDNKDGSWAVPEGKTITFRYRVVIFDGELSPSQLADAYQEYAKEK